MENNQFEGNYSHYRSLTAEVRREKFSIVNDAIIIIEDWETNQFRDRI